jgi:prephenate dehydrogenase
LQVIAVSRGDYHAEARAIGCEYFADPDDFAEQHPDIVILATSILSTRSVLDALPLQRLRRSTLFVDVLSVKVFPKQLLLQQLPKSMDILCTHPMFGPDSGRGSWQGLNFQFERVRLRQGKERRERMESFLQVRLLIILLASEGRYLTTRHSHQVDGHSVHILCIHPMFSPDSSRGSWEVLHFKVEWVWLWQGKERREGMESFLQVRLLLFFWERYKTLLGIFELLCPQSTPSSISGAAKQEAVGMD